MATAMSRHYITPFVDMCCVFEKVTLCLTSQHANMEVTAGQQLVVVGGGGASHTSPISPCAVITVRRSLAPLGTRFCKQCRRTRALYSGRFSKHTSINLALPHPGGHTRWLTSKLANEYSSWGLNAFATLT